LDAAEKSPAAAQDVACAAAPVAVPMPEAANVITSAPNDADNRLTRIIDFSSLNAALK